MELFFASRAFAWEKEFVNLVSVVVDEDTYDEVKTKLVRYSRDIQGVLENTRVVILPTPSDASVIDIASLWESLYLDGYKSLSDVDYESRLIGTVFVWKIPLPTVFDGAKSSQTMLPYIDFVDKSYIYNHESQKYEKNNDADTQLYPEIWHGVISPNTWDEDDDLQAIKDFFDKNHDFYTWQWVFDQEKWVIDGRDTSAWDDYEPYVFYYDQFRENEALQYQNYIGYESYLQNIEDISYNRYSKELAQRVSQRILWVQNADISDLLREVDPDFDISWIDNIPDADSSSDVLTRYITDNATKKLLEVFNGSTLWEMRKQIYNAGRYNDGGGRVNVDMPPFLISVLDQVSGELIKNVNTALESEITDIVQNGLSRKIVIPESKTIPRVFWSTSSENENGDSVTSTFPISCGSTSRGFFYGRVANDITSAAQCSIYRWSSDGGTLVEANRGYNIDLSEQDNILCQWDYISGDTDASWVSRWYWGGNTPLNFDISQGGNFSDISLKFSQPQSAIRPIFDILGSKEITDSAKIPSPLDCFEDGSWITTYKERLVATGWRQDWGNQCVLEFQAPVLWKSRWWSWTCRSNNNPTPASIDFETELAKNWNSGGSCVIRSLSLDDNTNFRVHSVAQTCSGRRDWESSCSCPESEGSSVYKTIPSYILHTSPTDSEFWLQTQSRFTPSLAIDTNRYIDFIGAKWGSQDEDYGYQRIDFPQLFRVGIESWDDLTLENTALRVEQYLDELSLEINSVIESADPDGLTAQKQELYEILKTWEYPEANIDLYSILQDKSLEVFTLQNESKEISYLDTLIFAVYWNNLDSVASKYKFIFQEYLSNQFEGNEYNFHLPKSKKSYEIAYFSAPGDAQNMYVKLDPELKGIHPYADIISQYIALNTTISSSNVWWDWWDEGVFECAPPDGVNIFEWVPAVICWLTEMLPPTIKINEWSCWESIFTQEEQDEIDACNRDDNKNGINDCLEQKLIWWELELVSDSGRYYYFTTGTIVSRTLTNTWELAKFDSSSYISHNISRVVVPENPELVFDSENQRVIYDRNIPELAGPEALKNTENYMSYNSSEIRSSRWSTKTYFYGKGQDADITFSASLETRDINGNVTINLESNDLEVWIRWDRLFIGWYRVQDDARYTIDSTIIASSEQNICAIDARSASLWEAVLQADTLSQAKEKLLLMFQNYSRAWNNLNLNYPLSIEVMRGQDTIFAQENISQWNLESVYGLLNISRSWRYEVHLRDSENFHSYRIFDVLPDSANSIDTVLGTNIIETGGNISTHLINILDQYNNPASGEIYTVSLSLSGDGLVFTDNKQKDIEYNVIEWYKAFRLTSTDEEDNNTLEIEVRNLSGQLIERESIDLRTIEKIIPEMTLVGNTPKVWWNSYNYNIRFTDESGNTLTDLNSRVYLTLPNIYGRVTAPYVLVENGVATVWFESSTLAGENVWLEIQLVWGADIYRETITILPEIPIKVDLRLSRDKIEASRDDFSILEAVLKDRYNNDVFNDSATAINLEIHPRSSDIITSNTNREITNKGKVQFEISGTDIPWLWYFSVRTDPDLANNSFEIIGQAPFEKEILNIPSFTSADWGLTDIWKRFFTEFSGTKYLSRYYSKSILEASESYNELPETIRLRISDFWDETNSLTVNGLGQNAGSIETFFFWDSEDISWNAYNSIYSMMLWAEYGDFTQQDYLAGSMLFDRDNASLAVSSLLNTPYKFHDVLLVERSWTFKWLFWWDISQDIQFKPSIDSDGRLILDIHNDALETYIWRAYYNTSSDTQVDVSITSSDYSTRETSAGLQILSQAGQSLFEISDDARFTRKSWSYLEIDTDEITPWLHLRVMNGQNTIARMSISGDFDTNITRDTSLLETKLSSLENTIILYLWSNQYSSRSSYNGDESSLNIYYQDPFATRYALDDFHNNDISGIESTIDEAWIGWQDSNTSLLSFASGDTLWEASRNFHSFSLVHLWDPVISLKPLSKTFRGTDTEKYFDPTVGTLIESDSGLIWYKILDYNDDTQQDLITIHRDGYVSLYENQDIHGDYIYQRDLVYAADGWSVRLVETWDFTWDGHDDIFFVSQYWKPALFNNVQKDFSRYDVEQSITLSWAIIQAETFDMDSDGKDDIVTLDDAWQIHIFYGSWTPNEPIFTKKFIWDGYAIELSDTATSHGGWIYFDGLVQLSDDRASQILTNSQQYLQELETAQANGEDGVDPEFIDESLVESFLYLSLPYTPRGFLDNRTNDEILTDALTWELSSDPEAATQTQSSVEDFLANYNNYVSYTWFENPQETQTYFLRGQYASQEWIEVSKTFTDTSPDFLQSGDRVFYDISITNTSSERKENVAYVDTIPKYFQFTSNTFTVLTQDNLELTRNAGINNYSILLDWFFLEPGEEVVVRYELESLPLSYGFLQVGLYEAGELWDDIYGDIILKEDEKNCGNQADIYRSTDLRSYEWGTTVPECRESDIELWREFWDIEDLNGDGVPDYIQDLITAADNNESIEDLERIQDYSDDILEQLGRDSDGDGIPDSDDTMDNTDSATDFMGALDNINEAIDEISEDIDELIQGLSCGFGWGSCIATPLNWAPLAPWNDPTLFGNPIGDGLRVSEWVPVFSALTGFQATCGTSPCCLPSVYPVTSASFTPWPFCGPPGAGWSLGTNSATNFVRVFATPTLTGGFGIAVCFGGPASVAWNANPRGVHPIVPGWNCIVAAMPLMSCEGGEWDPWIVWYPYPWNGFGLIHANCDGTTQNDIRTPLEIESDFVRDYLEYLATWERPAGLYDSYVDSFSNLADAWAANFTLPTEPLINIGWGGTTAMGWSVNIDPSAIFTWNGDVVDIQNTRVAAFPWFMMDWVERQLDEITSKLTNLPKIFVILPDFWGIFDLSFDNFGDGISEAFDDGKSKADADRAQKQWTIDALRAQKSSLDCSGDDRLACKSIDLKITSLQWQQYGNGWKETLSWIREVYEFMGNIPLLNVESEVISVNVPWMEQVELNRFILDWKLTAEQWKSEVESKTRAWSSGASCDGTPAQIARCQQENDIKEQASLQAREFVTSLERNIQILEEYKEFPDKLAKLINIKEVWLEQILCNVEAISKLMWEWINTNGERFKAWVELYLLIKAILKSWQLFIDVFAGYEAECHECKNERQDLQNFTFQLISVAIPSLPVIEFPKWPDIILDLHNVRAGLTVYMPDFEINQRPIVLPSLPNLELPDVPSASFSLPALPTLPTFELPELPELPSLPTVELPDLPPPPKIPKLFGAVEGMLNIIKLITKAMCFLKQSPFVPEWRAGDQIAFLTERNGYLPTDFINVQPPAFSYSAISAIKVTTYVNLEFEMEFLLEAVRAITAPIDDMTNNVVNMFDISLSDINLSNTIPDDIDVDVELDGTIDTDISFAPLDTNPESMITLVWILSAKIVELISYMWENAHETMTNREFMTYVNNGLASTSFTSNPRTAEIQNLWAEVWSMRYTKEQDFIDELREKNLNKFDTFEDILRNEIEYSQQQQNNLGNIDTPEIYIQTSLDTWDRFDQYAESLEPYNIDMLDAAIALASGESESAKEFQEDIKLQWENLMNTVRWGLTAYSQWNLLWAVAGDTPQGESAWWVCHGNGAAEYVYEWIYVLQDDKNYRLFDYIDHLKWNEEIELVDSDNDGDDDVFYLTNGKLYFKENRQNSESKNYISLPPLIMSAGDNTFYNGEVYHESVNGFREASVSDGFMNVVFKKPTNAILKNFRLQYHTIVDRYLDESDSYTPESVETYIVDAIADLDELEILEETQDYVVQPHLATISYAGAIRWVTLTQEKLVNLRDDIESWNLITLTSGTPIYASDAAFTLTYRVWKSEKITVNIPRYRTLSFTKPVEVLALRGDAYVGAGIDEDIENTDIIDFIGMPLLVGAKISFDGNRDLLGPNDHIDIRYYDGSELFLDMRESNSYTLYDLWSSSREEYSIRQAVPNDFYYARLEAFHETVLSTKTHQILLSPQTQADTIAPQIGLNQKIRIPVYQSQEIDLTPYIYEDSGLSGISDVWVDFDLTRDSDEDWDMTNDADSENINITQSAVKITIEFGPYDSIFSRDIMLYLQDDNGNIASKKVPFEVYPPLPSIIDIEDALITGVIDEDLQDEPIRLYRYRGGIIEKLQSADGEDVVSTDDIWNYEFETSNTTDGLELTYSGSVIANIDEYTGRIDIIDPFVTTRVLPTNDPDNTSVYPEIVITRLGQSVFRQFLKVPEGRVREVSSLDSLEETGIYMKLINGEDYASFAVPLGVAYNPWSVSVYSQTDANKIPIMTLFADGRIDIDRANYRLQYQSLWEYTGFVLLRNSDNQEIADVLLHTNSSYILR